MADLRVGLPLVVGGITIVPVERISFQNICGKMGCWLSGLKEPFGIVICDEHGVRAIDMQSNKISIKLLRDAIPDLDGLLVSLSCGEAHQGEDNPRF